MNPFKAPKESLGDLPAEVAATLIATAADIALVVDGEGVIRDVAVGSDDLSDEGYGAWMGREWIETVTVESRPKIMELLRDAVSKAPPRWRQVNHPSAKGADVPVRYSTVQVGSKGRFVAIGRDLRGVASLQQRLVDAQQSMEREYARIRHAETRYRLLFQFASEAVLIVDAGTHKVIEANPAAVRLTGKPAKKIIGKALSEIFSAEGDKAVQDLLSEVRGAARTDGVRARLTGGDEFLVSASLFRQKDAAHFLVRLTPVQPESPAGLVTKAQSKLLHVVESLPDGFVVTGLDRRVLVANSAFVDLTQLANAEQVRGEPLERWLGRSDVDINVLIASLREHGSVRNYGTVIRGEYGSSEDVDVSAVSVLNGEQPCFGFTIRNVGRRFALEARENRDLPRSVEQLTELVGRVSLKELVRESTDMIERLCIEAALARTNDNRASAAEMLGLSRQSLYVKLRRYGLADHEDEA